MPLFIVIVTLIFVSGFQPEALAETVDPDTSQVYSAVEVMPEIEGGLPALYEHIEYPNQARVRGIEGRVFVKVIIDANGKVRDPKILKDIGGGCGDAAIEGIKKVTFTPGKQEGVAVKVEYTLPVTFKLNK